MKVLTNDISYKEFRAHFNLIQGLQHQVPSNAVRLVLASGEIFKGLVEGIGGNYVRLQTMSKARRIESFDDIVSLEYPAGDDREKSQKGVL